MKSLQEIREIAEDCSVNGAANAMPWTTDDVRCLLHHLDQAERALVAKSSCFAAHTQLLYRLDALVTRWTKGAYGPNWEDYPIVQQAVEALKAAIKGP